MNTFFLTYLFDKNKTYIPFTFKKKEKKIILNEFQACVNWDIFTIELVPDINVYLLTL